VQAQVLAGKTAIVTGAGSGIGLAIAKLFAAEGANVIMLDINPKSGEIAASMKKEGLNVQFKVCNVSDPVSVEEAVQFAIDTTKKVDVLVNVAGIADRLGIAETSLEDIDKVLNINLKGTMYTMKYTIPHMITNGGGSIVNIGSLSALLYRSSDAGDVYSASKGGINTLTNSAAIKYAKYHIRINSMQPGPTLTPMNEEVYKHWMPRVPLRRLGLPEDMAQTALFLASDASSFITAVSIPVTGGAHAAQAPSKKIDP